MNRRHERHWHLRHNENRCSRRAGHLQRKDARHQTIYCTLPWQSALVSPIGFKVKFMNVLKGAMMILWWSSMFHQIRGVTRLDGARGKQKVRRTHVRLWGLSEANVLYRRKYLWHCWDFSAPTAVIRRPYSGSSHGELWPPCPSTRRVAVNCMQCDNWRAAFLHEMKKSC